MAMMASISRGFSGGRKAKKKKMAKRKKGEIIERLNYDDRKKFLTKG
jgi:hypothetical protein